MQTAKWHQEMERFIDIKTVFLLERNIYDLHPYPNIIEGKIRWDMLLLDNYLYKYLKSKGYQCVVFYNHIDGFYCDFDKDSLNAFLDVSGMQANSRDGFCKVPISQAADIIRAACKNKSKLVAVVMTLASRYVLASNNLSEAERDFFAKLMIASMKKTQISVPAVVPTSIKNHSVTSVSAEDQFDESNKNNNNVQNVATARANTTMENKFQNNLMIMLVEKANDVPVWFYLDNPMVKTLMISEPDKVARNMFIDTQLRFFPGGDDIPSEKLAKAKDTFTTLTDGFKYLELNALKAFCRKEKIDIARIQDAINMYKYGIKDNPWKDIDPIKLDSAETFIWERVKGQNAAVVQTLDVIKRAVCNMTGLQHSSSAKPKGILFFAGPTGTGKTELAKTMANLLFGDDDACIRFDMSEYQQSHSDQKLLGAPPGYVGYEAGGQLTNAIREKPFSIILFDEIEKAHPTIFDKFLQILEDGRMTDGKGETVYFSECIIIFTSNLGIYRVNELGQRELNVSHNMSYDELQKTIIAEIKDYFNLRLGRPEILNRIGENFVVFDFIRDEVAALILKSQIQKIIENIAKTKNIALIISSRTTEFLYKKAFGNLESGGRGIGNMIEKNLITPLSRYLFDNKVTGGVSLTIIDIKEENSLVSLECEVV
jgi:ATP-dependent Clp protease ATP-binding subunit ClpA